ncbi:hypothetical protein BJ122_102248 [Rhodopseudomonas faecalis]|uniref:Minor tail protein Z (GPZ) n=1 Tax=Rhodopseudomonas faecalis TaxID=99655 RepID=A0A318TJH5_9BRAD|nr:hypothetical protein [Rhodopseudomonas faecalis]PYF05022.1 hypothetical protein BJ122_102248 [Rhodopseudomonas faecalis]
MSGLELKVEFDPAKVTRFHNMVAVLGSDKARLAMCRALNHEGDKARTKVIAALTDQTGLQRQVIARAVKRIGAYDGSNGGGARMQYLMESAGGDVRLKFFRSRETQSGVTAYPHNTLTRFPHYFIRGGKWPARVALKFGGEVKYRAGKSRLPIKTAKSGVVIPAEMVQGATADAFQGAAGGMADRIMHELTYLMGGV